MLVAVAEEIGEATLVLAPFDVTVFFAGAAAIEGVGLPFGGRHGRGVEVAVLVGRGLAVALDAEGVARAAAVDAEFGIGAGKVDRLAAVAHLVVIWFLGGKLKC